MKSTGLLILDLPFFSSLSLECNESAVFVVTHHGGHLGFYEGGFFTVFPLTWLDKAVIQYINAVLKVKNEGKLSSLSEQDEEYVSAS